MRFAAKVSRDRAASSGVRFLTVALALTGVLIGCAKTSSPTAPDRQPNFLGTWVGSIASDVLGTGGATIVLDFQVGPRALQLMSGNWSFTFPDPVFSSKGIVSTSLDTTGTKLVLIFDRGAVPCPGEPSGVAQRTIAANLTFTDTRMHGSYIVGGCPGGTLDLARK